MKPTLARYAEIQREAGRINWPIPRSLASVLLRGPAQFGHPVGHGPSHVSERQEVNFRAFNGTAPASAVVKTISEVRRRRLVELTAGIPTPAPKPKLAARTHRRRTRAPAITPAQIARAIEGRAGDQSWKTIGRRLKVHPDSIRNAVSRAR